MYFTREPIVETIVTPREGYNLVIRNSKIVGGEEYAVAAVEVVSFGTSLFLRSLEKPKPFLLPVSDYEIVEARQARISLKHLNAEKNIKIGGGRAPQRASQGVSQKDREETEEDELVVADAAVADAGVADAAEEESSPASDQKRQSRKRARRRKDRRENRSEEKNQTQAAVSEERVEGMQEEVQPKEERVSEGAALPSPPPLVLIRPPSRMVSDAYPKREFAKDETAVSVPQSLPAEEADLSDIPDGFKSRNEYLERMLIQSKESQS